MASSQPPVASELYAGKKPRAFENEIKERFGGGSCWISAALQAMFAPDALKRALSQIWYELPSSERRKHQRSVNRYRRHFRVEDPGPRLVNLRTLPANGPTIEQRLAIAFGCPLGEPMTESFMPKILTDHYYQLHQEDTAELLLRHLLNGDASPVLAPLMTIHFDEIYRCKHCGEARDPNAAQLQSFELPIELSGLEYPEPILFHDVQSAFNHHLSNDFNDFEFENPCLHCQQNRWSTEVRATRFPEVLLLTLKRFKVLQISEHEFERRSVTHQVTPTQVLDFQGQLYNLRSVVVHLGPSIESGHYVALAQHRTNTGTWWLYDCSDSSRIEVKPGQLETSTTYKGYGRMKSYVLFYEKQSNA